MGNLRLQTHNLPCGGGSPTVRYDVCLFADDRPVCWTVVAAGMHTRLAKGTLLAAGTYIRNGNHEQLGWSISSNPIRKVLAAKNGGNQSASKFAKEDVAYFLIKVI
jgi:hypothetical protein